MLNQRKPNLVAYSMRRQVMATVISLIVVLVVLVFSVDKFMLHLAAMNMTYVQREQPNVSPRPSSQMRGNYAILDANGVIVASRIPSADRAKSIHQWLLAPKIIKLTQMHGVGDLPWVNKPVVWSATSADNRITVRWRRVDTVRTDSRGIYMIVILAVLVSSMISLAFATDGARKIAKSVMAVTEQSSHMADGHFEVQVSPQPTVELQQLGDNLNDLARGLDQTIKELQSEHLRLKALEVSQRQFVADASHELRAPLSSLSLTLRAWDEGMLRPEEQKQTVSQMQTEVQRLARIVSSLLELSRIDAGRSELDIVPIDFHQLTATTLSMLPDAGAPITTEFQEPLPMLNGSVDGLQRILVNLLDNARRYTSAEGRITLSAERNDQMVTISVTDTGCGMSDELVSRIWQRFTRGASNRSCQDEGVGLGLPIVRGLAEAMGGSVSIQSELGVGTKVTVNIPVFQYSTDNS